MIVHEIEPDVFVPFPSGRPVIRMSTVETVIVRREDGSAMQQDRATQPYPVPVRPPEAALAWPVAEREAVGLFEAVPFTPPMGKRAIGDPSYRRSGGKIVEVYAVEDLPPPAPEPTRQERLGKLLAAHGLTTGDLRAVLTGEADAK